MRNSEELDKMGWMHSQKERRNVADEIWGKERRRLQKTRKTTAKTGRGGEIQEGHRKKNSRGERLGRERWRKITATGQVTSVTSTTGKQEEDISLCLIGGVVLHFHFLILLRLIPSSSGFEYHSSTLFCPVHPPPLTPHFQVSFARVFLPWLKYRTFDGCCTK